MEAQTDERLLARARAGDREALEELLLRHQARVYRFGLKMCGQRADAEDVSQETLLALARGIRDFRGASSLTTWLYSVARSFCIKKRRRSKFAPSPGQMLDATHERVAGELRSPERGADEALARAEVERAIQRALGEVDPLSRDVLVLRDMEGLTAPEVAEVLGISTPAVKSRLHRARLSLREQLAPLLGVPEPAGAVGSTCPDVLTLFSRHLEDEISGEVCSEMQRHLATCPRCRGTCDSLQRTLALCDGHAAAEEVPAVLQKAVRTALQAFLSESVNPS